jgi:hypothetical protein
MVSRRYEVAAVIGVTIVLISWARLVPLPFYALIQGGLGLYVTFTSFEPEEVLRSRLISAAASDLTDVAWFGRGVHFYALVPSNRFVDMWAGGVTESGVLDIALAFGVPATALFLAAILIALLAKRASVGWMPVLVTVFAGTLPFNNPLSFLGGTVFFGALFSLILQEIPDSQAYSQRMQELRLAMMPG